MITRRQLILIIIAVIALICVGIGMVIFQSLQRDKSFTVTEVDESNDTSQIIDVDYGDQLNILSAEQKRILPETLLLATTVEIPKTDRLNAVIRENSITSANGETLFIIDSEQLQTSYMISRYVSAEDSVDIVNVLCTPADKRIYEPDYCYEG